MNRRALQVSFGLLAGLAAGSSCATPPPRAPASSPATPTQSAAAERQAPLRAQVEQLLDRGTDAAGWKALGADPLGPLEQILNDPAQPPARRLQAVSALGDVESADAPARLTALLKDPKGAAAFRAAAAVALGKRAGRPAIAILKPVLADPDAALRRTVAQTLGALGGEDARAALEERLSKEEDPATREVMQQTLTLLQP